MERDFRYLRDKHGDAGAREAFENICVELFQNIYKNSYPVKAFPGDDGIDILVGDLTESITVFQCKYFIDGIGNSQKSQIKDSYRMVTDKYKVKEWYLCVPIIFTINDHKWWSDWKSSNNDEGITIGLYEGSTLLNKLKKCDLYNRIFDDDIRNMLGEYGKKLGNIEEHIKNINKKSVFEVGNYYKLPMQSKIFNGRFAELTEVSKGLKNNRIVVLYGVTGIGKSQIAKQYAYIHREEYHKIYWIFASSKNELLREYQQIAKVSNLPSCNEEDEDLLIQIVKHHFESENDSLIIYDGLDDMDIGEIKEYLPNGDEDILITTKNSNWDCNEVTVVNVNFIEPQDAIDFIMNNSLGRNISSTDSEDIKLLVKELSYYPLGLEYARAYIVARNISINEYFELFKKCRINLFYSDCTDYRKSALNAWKMSFDMVYEKEQNAYDFMAICSFMGNEQINYHEIFELQKYDAINLEKIVDALKRYSMINIISNCIQFHSVTQEFMRYQLSDSNKYNKYLLDCMQLLKNVFPNNINSIEERDKAISVLPHMEATFNFLPEHVDDTTIYELGVDISGLLYKMGLLKKSLEINEKILSYALKMGDYAKYSDTLNAIAIAAHYSGDTNKGFEFIDDAIRQIDNTSGVDIKIINALKASIYGNKGIMLKNIQQLGNALDCFNMALVYAEKSESLNLICNQLINLAIVNRHMGKIDDAEDILVQAKKYCADDKRLEAKVYGNLGFVYRYKDYNLALDYFKKSLELSREIMDQKTECTNLNHIGKCYMQLNMPDESYEYFAEAKKLALNINLQQAVVHSYNSLGIWFLNFRGDIEKAKEYFQNALSLSEALKYIDGVQAAKGGLEAIKMRSWW